MIIYLFYKFTYIANYNLIIWSCTQSSSSKGAFRVSRYRAVAVAEHGVIRWVLSLSLARSIRVAPLWKHPKSGALAGGKNSHVPTQFLTFISARRERFFLGSKYRANAEISRGRNNPHTCQFLSQYQVAKWFDNSHGHLYIIPWSTLSYTRARGYGVLQKCHWIFLCSGFVRDGTTWWGWELRDWR